MDQSVSDYLAEQFASKSDLTNFTFYMIASQLKTRLYIEEPGEQLSIREKLAQLAKLPGKGEDEEQDDGPEDEDGEDDEDEDDEDDRNDSDDEGDGAKFSDGHTLVELVTHKATFVRTPRGSPCAAASGP